MEEQEEERRPLLEGKEGGEELPGPSLVYADADELG